MRLGSSRTHTYVAHRGYIKSGGKYIDLRCYSGLGLLPISLPSSLPSFSLAGTSATTTTATTTITGKIAATSVVTETSQHPWPIPSKLVKRIKELEFVDMAELVPDNWRYEEEEASKCCHQPKRQRRGPVSDILLWVECYSLLVEVLCTTSPGKMAQFMSYQRTIVRAQRTFTGDGWITYDTCYRRKAAATKSLEWGQVDFNLYNETFTGRAKSIARCKYCSSEHHAAGDCRYAPEHGRLAMSPRQAYARFESSRPSDNICHLFNHKAGNRCRFSPCKFSHSCTECQGSHPASQCRSRPTSKGGRFESPRGRR